MSYWIPEKYRKRETIIANFGQIELETLGDHFGHDIDIDGVIHPAVISYDELREEHQQFKHMLYGLRNMSFIAVCTLLFTEYREIYPNITTLATIAAVIPVSSVPCERGFSVQNRVKNCRRNRLNEDVVNDLMMITMQGPAVGDFDFREAMLLFRQQRNRRK